MTVCFVHQGEVRVKAKSAEPCSSFYARVGRTIDKRVSWNYRRRELTPVFVHLSLDHNMFGEIRVFVESELPLLEAMRLVQISSLDRHIDIVPFNHNWT